MQLIPAKITGKPRNVNTKHGDRSVVDARAANGENLTIWRPANDPEVMRLANGERVQLAIDSKGKVSIYLCFCRSIISREASYWVSQVLLGNIFCDSFSSQCFFASSLWMIAVI
jgi:hypothetical protein